VRSLVQLVEQVPSRAIARFPIALDQDTVGMLVLWTLIRWERTFVLGCLEELGVDMWRLTCDLDLLLRERKERDARERFWGLAYEPATPGFWSALEYGLNPWLDRAEGQARALGHTYLGTEHLLLALVAGARGPLAELLARHGLEHARVEQALRAALARGMPPETPLGSPLAAPVPGPAGARWDTPAAGVPRRFGLGILLLMTAMFAVLFAALKVLGAPLAVFLVVVVLFAGVGLGQMVLFRGKYPRAASVWTGAVLFPLEILAVFAYYYATEGPGRTPGGEMLCLFVFGIPLGAGFGYLAGGLTAGVFYLLDRYQAKHRKAQPAEGEASDPFAEKADEDRSTA
jgi:hypothetical protein